MPLPPTTFARTLRMASACGAWLLLCVCAAAQPAAPTGAPSSAEADAEALILQGLKLREQGQDAEALRLFERAHALAPTPRAMAQRALAEQAIGDWVQAEAHLLQALAAAEDPWIAQHRPALEGALGVIGEHLGSLQVIGGAAGAELKINGRLVGTLPLAAPLRVVVGRPMLEVTMAGHYPVRREIAIKAGSLSTESIELVPMPAPAPAADARPSEPLHGAGGEAAVDREAAGGLPPFVFWTAAGVTAALGGVALWSGLNTLAKNDAYEQYSQEPGARADVSRRAFEDAESAQTRTNALLAGTAVAAAATVVIGTLFTDWAGKEAESAARATGTSARVSLATGARGHGLVLQGTF